MLQECFLKHIERAHINFKICQNSPTVHWKYSAKMAFENKTFSSDIIFETIWYFVTI